MYIIDFLKCMDPKLLIRNKKGVNMAFITILVLIIAFAVLIWFIFFAKKMATKGDEGVKALDKVVGLR